jgi:cytochrome P450
VGKTLFDADVLAEAGSLGAALTTVMRYSNARRGALVRLPAGWPTPRNRRFRAARARLDSTVYRIIAERRRSGEDRGDLLSVLLRSHSVPQDADDGGFMTDRQVRDEAMTLFLAGHETTANALSWTWYLLAQHPQVYARLRAEVDMVLAGRSPTLADLEALPYTLRVLKESMRLYPPAYIMLRYTIAPITVGGHRVPRGALLVLSPYTLHRRPDCFPDPERFDPERFAPEAEARLPRNAYLPFGAGPRSCIGNHFALMEAHLVLATLAQRVTFELVRGQRVDTEPLITLRPRNGIQMIVRRRATAVTTA